MDFFDKLGEVAKNLTEKAGDNLEINRMNGEISIEKGNIQCFQRELGEYYWAKFAIGEKLDEEAMLICDKVVVSQDRIRHLEMEIERIKKERELILEERAKAKALSSEDEAEQTKDEMISQEQKTVINEAAINKEEERPKFCGNCGGAIKEGQRFCIFCGAEAK